MELVLEYINIATAAQVHLHVHMHTKSPCRRRLQLYGLQCKRGCAAFADAANCIESVTCHPFDGQGSIVQYNRFVDGLGIARHQGTFQVDFGPLHCPSAAFHAQHAVKRSALNTLKIKAKDCSQ